MKNCYILHGIHTRNPHKSIGKLAWFISPERDGLRPILLTYGFMLATLANIANWFLVRKFSQIVEEGSIGIGHSNGCTIMHEVSKNVAMTGLVLINPALDNDVLFDSRLKFIHIYWSKGDEVVRWSALLPFSKWGKLGATGYKGPHDPRVREWEMGGIGHAAITTTGWVMHQWGPIIVARIVEALKEL